MIEISSCFIKVDLILLPDEVCFDYYSVCQSSYSQKEHVHVLNSAFLSASLPSSLLSHLCSLSWITQMSIKAGKWRKGTKVLDTRVGSGGRAGSGEAARTGSVWSGKSLVSKSHQASCGDHPICATSQNSRYSYELYQIWKWLQLIQIFKLGRPTVNGQFAVSDFTCLSLTVSSKSWHYYMD